MKSFKKWIISSTFIIALLVMVPSFFSNAYLNQNFGWQSTSIPVKNATSSSYTTVVKNSIMAWNNAIPGGVNIYQSNTTDNTIYSGNYADSWVGYYSYYTSDGKTYKFNIYLNDKFLLSQSNNYKQSTLVHELGHAFSLADNPPQKKSIMRYDRNRNKIYTPQSDDINGVKNFYNIK